MAIESMNQAYNNTYSALKKLEQRIDGAIFRCHSQREKHCLLNKLREFGYRTIWPNESRLDSPFYQYLVVKCYVDPIVLLHNDQKVGGCIFYDNAFNFLNGCKNLYRSFQEIETQDLVFRSSLDKMPFCLQHLAITRALECSMAPININRSTVNDFCWSSTDEGDTFWMDVYMGKIPSDLSMHLFYFDISRIKKENYDGGL